MSATPVERLSERESARLKARIKREALMRNGQLFWDDVLGRTYRPIKHTAKRKRRPDDDR